MNKKEILIMECVSSGFMYAEEALKRGYKALVVNLINGDDYSTKHKHDIERLMKVKYNIDQIEFIYCEPSIELIYNSIKNHNIICAVAGSEYAVRYIDLIAEKLGLKHNNPDTVKYRSTKLGMFECLKNAGLRKIETCVVENKKDVINFFDINKLDKVFMKYSSGAGSIGNKICYGLDDACNHYKTLCNSSNAFGADLDDILIQEVIDGPEYVVNSVSCNGKHKITDIWKYDKITSDDGEQLYNTSTLIEEINTDIQRLLEYAFKVLDAEQIKYGPVHAEYKIDSKGPVLIEINCRPMGDSTTSDYQSLVAGNCIVDWSLDSYLDEDKFFQINDEYRINQSAVKKYVILKDKMVGDMKSGFFIAENLKSYHNHNSYEADGYTTYEKTIDLDTSPMILKMTNKDKNQLSHDVDFMRILEQEYPDLLVCPNPTIKSSSQPSINEIQDRIIDGMFGSKFNWKTKNILVYCNNNDYVIADGKILKQDIDKSEKFDTVVYAECMGGDIVYLIKRMLDLYKHLKKDGYAACIDEAVENLPYKNKCFELIGKI